MAREGGKRAAWSDWPGLLLCWALAGLAHASSLEDWRLEAQAVRTLAENDTARAAERAAQLIATKPANATPRDQVLFLNLRARIALYRAETETAGALAEKALALAERTDDRVGQAEADLVIALNTVNQGKFDRLIAVTNHAVKVLEGTDRPDLLAEAMLRLAMTYTRFGKLEESVDACLRTLDLARRSGNALAMAYGHQCVASSYNSSDNFAESLEHYRQMQVQARAANSRLLEAQALSGQGGVVSSQGEVRRGEAMIRQASALYRSIGLPFYLTASLYAEASQARQQGDHGRAIALLDEAERTFRRLPNKTGLWWTLTARAGDKLALHQLAGAEQDLRQALDIAHEIKLPLYLSETERQLGRVAARRGDYKQAYQHSLAAADMIAEANRKKISTRVLELAERYQQEARQREIAELTRRNEQQKAELRERTLQQRWLWTVLGAIVLVLAVLAFFLLRLRRSHRMLAEANSGLRQSQEALQRQTGILQSVLDSMGDGVAVTDQQGRLVLVNPAAERCVGIVRLEEGMAWPPERLFYRPDRRTRIPDQELPLARALRREGEHGPPEPDISAEIFMSGAGLPEAGRWLYMTARPLAGAQAGAVAVISDITERKRAEEKIRALNANLESMVQQRTAQLRQQTRYLRVLIDTIPWWVWFKDTDSRYLAVNRATAAILGTGVDEMVGKSDFDVKPPEVAQAFIKDDLKVMQSRRPQTVEEVQQGPHGPLWVEIFKTPVTDEDGTVLGTVGLARDISARKETEAARDAALLEAQRLAGMRSEFLAQMSHELRTPLNAVLGFVQLLLRDGGLDDRQLASVTSIRYSGEHLLGLINDVLDSAKLEASKLQLFPQRVELGVLLEAVAAMIRIKASERGLDFACTVGEGVPAVVLVDEQRLRQVLLNLLSNAIKFTDRGSVRLKVTAAVAGRLRFAVQDSGVGIEPGQLESIFQPFEQVGEAQRRFGGTGLGLAISRQLVRLMGSEIQVESQPGVGSLFWFELALAGNEETAAALPPAAAGGAPELPLPVLPAAELERLRQLVRIGNMRAILAHADHLQALEMRFAPLAEQMRLLARGYQSKALGALLERLQQLAATS